MAQRLLNPIIARGTHAMAAGLAPGSPHRVRLKHYHGRKGDHRERLLDFLRSVGDACRVVAMIEGNLHCLGFLRRKKGRP